MALVVLCILLIEEVILIEGRRKKAHKYTVESISLFNSPLDEGDCGSNQICSLS